MKNIYYTTSIICLFLSSFYVNAQDIDTLDWEEIVELTDTIYKESLDTIYLINDSIAESESFRTGSSAACLTSSASFSINLNKTIKTINKGQYGINVTGMFTKTTLYNSLIDPTDIYSDEQWQWLSDLKPKALRFPGGSSSKFMHLLPYRDVDGLPGLDPIKGYGYDIVEITRYFDAIDSVFEAPDNAAAILAASDATLSSWFGGNTDIVQAFKPYKEDFYFQEFLDTGDMFIDQFINLVDKIQTENGYSVDVIVCLNILTETAEQCMAIVEYLENNGVNVAGVEMGNETANKFHRQIMRFNEFEDYWKYLDGQNVSWQEDLEVELGVPLFIPASDRNFLLEFKNKAGVNYKVALCASGLDTAGHIFITSPEEDAGTRAINWNTALQSHYGDSFTPGTIKKFHAVILHTYYSPDAWYDECIIGPDSLNPYLDEDYSCPIWDTINQDARLQESFDAARLNFRNFIINRYDDEFNAFNLKLQFNLTNSTKKDMWITEWNFKDEGTEDDRGKVFTNGFMHGVLLQEWWMKNLKLNFTSGYRENFFKYSTLQNLAGGSAIAMLTPASEDVELDILGKNYAPYNLSGGDPDKRNYYVRRTNWFIMQLISEINKNNLNYFPATVATAGHNPNLPPTFFITPDKEYVYMYFSNSRCKEQKYVLNPGGMYPMFGYTVELADAEIHAIDAYQAYSTSGNSKLYEINNCYAANPYTIEIDSIYTNANPGCTAPSGSLCISVPGFNIGYVKMRVIPYVPKIAEQKTNVLSLYPNPANELLNISSTEEIQTMEIYAMTGTKISEYNSYFSSLDVSALSYGMYQIVCIFKDGSRIVKSFIKS